MSALTIKYNVAHSSKILEQIAQQVPSAYEQGLLRVESNTVEGSLSSNSLSEDLSIYGVSIRIKQNMTVTREGLGDEDLMILDFHIDSFAKLFFDSGDQSQLIAGSYLSSAGYASSAEYPPGTEARFVSLILSKTWLRQNISIKEDRLKDTLNGKEDFFFFREIGYQLASEVHDLYHSIYETQETNETYLYGCAYKILGIYFREFTIDDDATLLTNAADLRAIEEVKRYIDMNPQKKIKLEQLLDMAAMSESKFRGLFKSIVGIGPSEYHIKSKVWYAKSLIEAGDPISSVVLKIGYSNHSYFTRTFKSMFGLTPQKYQEESTKLRNSSRTSSEN